MELQLVVQDGARRVWISTSEGVQHGAHQRGLGDLGPKSRVRAAGQKSMWTRRTMALTPVA